MDTIIDAGKKRLFKLIVMIGVLLIVTTLTMAQAGTPDGPFVAEGLRDALAQAGSSNATFRVIVGLDVGYAPEHQLGTAATVASQRSNIQTAQARVLAALGNASSRVANVKRFQTIPFFAVEVDAAGLARLQNDPRVTGIWEDQIFRIETAEANPLVGAPPTWDVGFDGSGYAVAILDSGVDATHPAFTGGKVVAEACFSDNPTEPDSVYSDSACPNNQSSQIGPGAAAPPSASDCPDCWHGTHVAGIAAGNDGQVNGFRGVAPGADIIAVNVFSIFPDPSICYPYSAPCAGSFESDQIRGLEWVYGLRNNPDINIASVNMSLGFSAYTGVCDGIAFDWPGYGDVLANLRAANIAVVAASGNFYQKNALSRPACYSNVVSVGSTTVAGSTCPLGGTVAVDDTVSYFSNSASFLDLLAPGECIVSSVPGGYGSSGGTSMATPYVAGTWAIMRQVYGNVPVSTVLSKLKSAGIPVTDPYNGVTTPRIQVDRSTLALFEPSAQITDGLGNPTYTWNQINGATGYDIWVGKNGQQVFHAMNVNAGCTDPDTSCSFDPTSINNSAWLTNGTHTVWLRGVNGATTIAPWSGPFSFTVNIPAPTPVALNPVSNFANPGEVAFSWTVDNEALNGNAVWFHVKVDRVDSVGNVTGVDYNEWHKRADVCGTVEGTTCNVAVGSAVTLATGQRYRVRVQSWGAGGMSVGGPNNDGWTGPAYFYVGSEPPVVPIPTVDNSQVVPIVSWPDDADAQWFQVVIVRDGVETIYNKWHGKSTAGDPMTCDNTTCSLQPPTLAVVNGNYTAWMRAWGPAGMSAGGPNGDGWGSDSFNMAFNPPAPPAVSSADFFIDPAAVSITGNLSGAAGNASWLHLQIREVGRNGTPSAVAYNVWRRRDQVCGSFEAMDCTFAVPGLMLHKRYQARMRSWGPGGMSVGGPQGDGWSAAAPFCVGGACPGLVSGVNVDTNLFPQITIEWDDDLAAQWFHVVILRDGVGTVYNDWRGRPGTTKPVDNCDGSVCTLTPTGNYTNGSYTIWMEAWGQGGYTVGAPDNGWVSQGFTVP